MCATWGPSISVVHGAHVPAGIHNCWLVTPSVTAAKVRFGTMYYMLSIE